MNKYRTKHDYSWYYVFHDGFKFFNQWCFFRKTKIQKFKKSRTLRFCSNNKHWKPLFKIWKNCTLSSLYKQSFIFLIFLVFALNWWSIRIGHTEYVIFQSRIQSEVNCQFYKRVFFVLSSLVCSFYCNCYKRGTLKLIVRK